MDKQSTLTPKLMNDSLSKYCIVSVLSLRLTLSLYLYHILSTNFYFPKFVSFSQNDYCIMTITKINVRQAYNTNFFYIHVMFITFYLMWSHSLMRSCVLSKKHSALETICILRVV